MSYFKSPTKLQKSTSLPPLSPKQQHYYTSNCCTASAVWLHRKKKLAQRTADGTSRRVKPTDNAVSQSAFGICESQSGECIAPPSKSTQTCEGSFLGGCLASRQQYVFYWPVSKKWNRALSRSALLHQPCK